MERVASGLFLVGGLLFMVRTCTLSGELAAADAAANLLRTEELLEDADAAGWEAALVESRDGLTRRLQEANDRGALLEGEKAELARSAELLGGELRIMADMYADVVGQIDAHEAVVFAPDASTGAPDSVVAQVDDGLLRGSIRFRPPAELSLEYRIRLGIALGIVDTPDGRAMITAKAEHPKVELSYGELYYDAPAPVQYCSIGTRAAWGLGGAGVGSVAVLLAKLVSSFGG